MGRARCRPTEPRKHRGSEISLRTCPVGVTRHIRAGVNCVGRFDPGCLVSIYNLTEINIIIP